MKGAHCKLVLMYVAWLAVQLVSSGVDVSEYSKLRATMAWSLLDSDRVLVCKTHVKKPPRVRLDRLGPEIYLCM